MAGIETLEQRTRFKPHLSPNTRDPERDRLISAGYSTREMGKILGLHHDTLLEYIDTTEQRTQWQNARQEYIVAELKKKYPRIALYARQGLSDEELEQIYGKDRCTIRRTLDVLNLADKRNDAKKRRDIAKFKARYPRINLLARQGLTLQKIGDEYKTDRSTARYILKKLGLTETHHQARMRQGFRREREPEDIGNYIALTPEQTAQLERALDLPTLSPDDISSFLCLPVNFVRQQNTQRDYLTFTPPLFKASRIYEAADMQCKEKDIATYADTHPKIVRRALISREQLEPRIAYALSVIHQEPILTPYIP